MLGVVAKETGLPSPVVRVAKPAWVVAETINLGDGMSMLLIYKSTWLRDSDPDYVEVVEILGRNASQVIYHQSREDEDMMHGRAEWYVYLLNPVDDPSSLASTVIDFVLQWGTPLHPLSVPAEIRKRFQTLQEVR